MMDSKNVLGTGVSTLEAARDSVQALLHENDPVLFPSGHTGCSVSALATTIAPPMLSLQPYNHD